MMSSTSQTGVTTTFAYDAFQREVSQTDGRGNTTHTVYDSLGRVTSTIDVLGYTTTCGYDALGRQISVTDPLTNTVYTAYNSEEHVVSQRGATYPVDYAYDEFGEKISMTTYRDLNASGDVTRWLRDEATGLVTNTVYSDGTPTISLAYNRAGRQVRAHDAAGVTIFLYDGFGAVTNETVVGAAGTNTIERFYDNFGRSLGYALNGVRQTTLAYDPATGRLATMLANGCDTPFTWNYLAGSDLKSSLA
jgi:YD repeat-containing protein